jgi:hypothetical protein
MMALIIKRLLTAMACMMPLFIFFFVSAVLLMACYLHLFPIKTEEAEVTFLRHTTGNIILASAFLGIAGSIILSFSNVFPWCRR